MIIIPTEKRFDWAHTPLVLIAIVAINILVFLGYQSGDSGKIQSAVTEYFYNDYGYLEEEWPLFKDYLNSNGEDELSEQLQAAFDSEAYPIVASQLLLRDDFYQHLNTHHSELLTGSKGQKRAEINQQANTVSYLSYGLIPDQTTLVTLITHQFLHGDVFHLLGNLFFLIICGFAVEAAIGHGRFLLFYVISGLAGGLAHAYLGGNQYMPLVGASGAISGVMAMYVAIFWLKRIEFFYWFFVFVGYFKVPALCILPFYIAKEVYQFYQNSDSGVAFMAHAGGFIAGAIVITLSRLLMPKTINDDYIEEDQTLSPYQKDLAEIYDLIEKYRFAQASKKIAATLSTYGSNFELAKLHYQLLKIDKKEGYQKATTLLLTTPSDSSKQLATLDSVWRENSELHDKITAEQKVKLAIQLTERPDLQTAEALCQQLLTSHYRDSSLSILARKLSNAFGKSQQLDKQAYFEKVADDLLAGVY